MAKKASPARPSKRPGRGSDQFIVRLPEGMRKRIADVAELTEQSMNSVIIEALSLHLQDVRNPFGKEEDRSLMERVEALEIKVRLLEK